MYEDFGGSQDDIAVREEIAWSLNGTENVGCEFLGSSGVPAASALWGGRFVVRSFDRKA
jgi:hypothetical protein